MNIPAAPATRRLFIAVMLPPETQARLARAIEAIDAQRECLRPVRAEALHLTLRFLGDQDQRQERLAAQACAEAVVGVAAFPLVFGGFGAFPNARRARVIWLGLRMGAEPLMALHRRVQDELLRRGVIVGVEQFTPHLTLARVRPEASPATRAALAAALSALPDAEHTRCTADTVSLVHSTLTPRGSQYSIVESWPLH